MPVNLLMISGEIVSDPRPFNSKVAFKLKNLTKLKNKASGNETMAHVVVIAYGEAVAECVSLKQGDNVMVEGKMRTSREQGPDGKHSYFLEVHTNSIQKM